MPVKLFAYLYEFKLCTKAHRLLKTFTKHLERTQLDRKAKLQKVQKVFFWWNTWRRTSIYY